MNFDAWMMRVDAILERNFGVDHLSLEDHDWENCYEDNLTPTEAVEDFFDIKLGAMFNKGSTGAA